VLRAAERTAETDEQWRQLRESFDDKASTTWSACRFASSIHPNSLLQWGKVLFAQDEEEAMAEYPVWQKMMMTTLYGSKSSGRSLWNRQSSLQNITHSLPSLLVSASQSHLRPTPCFFAQWWRSSAPRSTTSHETWSTSAVQTSAGAPTLTPTTDSLPSPWRRGTSKVLTYRTLSACYMHVTRIVLIADFSFLSSQPSCPTSSTCQRR
jgi:hypothetical protein